MADLHFGQRAAIWRLIWCNWFNHTRNNVSCSSSCDEWMGMGYFTIWRSKPVACLLLFLFIQVCCFQPDSSWGEQLCMMYYQIIYGCLLCSKTKQHRHYWLSTTVYQSEFQCESKQADPADVSVQKIPWSWGCPEPSWRCLLHAGCHSSLVNRSPPCKHHQWSPPVETKIRTHYLQT